MQSDDTPHEIEERTVYEVYDASDDYYATGNMPEDAAGWIAYYQSHNPFDPPDLRIVEVRQRRRVGDWNWMSVFDDNTPRKYRASGDEVPR